MEQKKATGAVHGYCLVLVLGTERAVLVDVGGVVVAVGTAATSPQGQGRFHGGCLLVNGHSSLLSSIVSSQRVLLCSLVCSHCSSFALEGVVLQRQQSSVSSVKQKVDVARFVLRYRAHPPGQTKRVVLLSMMENELGLEQAQSRMRLLQVAVRVAPSCLSRVCQDLLHDRSQRSRDNGSGSTSSRCCCDDVGTSQYAA